MIRHKVGCSLFFEKGPAWMCSCKEELDEIKEEQAMKQPIKRYYMGAKHIGAAIKMGHNADCTRDTFEQALEDARNAISTERGVDTVVIVKIIAVVRRDSPPVVVDLLDKDE